jgi:hypothetical protein
VQSITNRLLDDKITETHKRLVIIEIIIIISLFTFFSVHILLNTGFFNLNFEASEFLILYGLLFLNLGTSLLRLKFQSKNSSRPIRMLSNILTATGLLIIFLNIPFNPSKFGVFIPEIGEALSELLITNIQLIMQSLIFLFAMFGIYDAVLIYLYNRRMDLEVSTQ